MTEIDIADLQERLTKLEAIVYDKLEYPEIQASRTKSRLDKTYVCANPLKFDVQFHDKLLDGSKTATFRRTRKGRKEGDSFSIRGHVFKIEEIISTNLEDFINRYYLDDGFRTIADAREYFTKLYFNGEYQRDFYGIEGYRYEFREV